MVAPKIFTIVTKNIFKSSVRCPLLGLGLHPSLALWLAFPPLRHGGGHLPELVGGVVLAPHLLGLGLPPVHPGGGHLPELGHGGRGQQCWTDWAWVCIAGWCYHWSGASCWVASPQQTPHPALLGECQVVLAGGMVLAPPLHDLVLLPVHGHELVSPSVHPGGGHLPELDHGG